MYNPRKASIEVDGARAGDSAAKAVRIYFSGSEGDYRPTLSKDLLDLSPKERVNAMLKLLEFVLPKAAQKTEINNQTTVLTFEGKLRELIDGQSENIKAALKSARKQAALDSAEDIIIPNGEDAESDNEITQEYGDFTDNQET